MLRATRSWSVPLLQTGHKQSSSPDAGKICTSLIDMLHSPARTPATLHTGYKCLPRFFSPHFCDFLLISSSKIVSLFGPCSWEVKYECDLNPLLIMSSCRTHAKSYQPFSFKHAPHDSTNTLRCKQILPFHWLSDIPFVWSPRLFVPNCHVQSPDSKSHEASVTTGRVLQKSRSELCWQR